MSFWRQLRASRFVGFKRHGSGDKSYCCNMKGDSQCAVQREIIRNLEGSLKYNELSYFQTSPTLRRFQHTFFLSYLQECIKILQQLNGLCSYLEQRKIILLVFNA